MKRTYLFGALVVGTLLVLGACHHGQSADGAGGGGNIMLNGAGATFPFPLYSKWMDEYHKAHPTIRINYQSIGSGGGIRQITAGTVDFGASDAPMKPAEEQAAPSKLYHIPTTLGAVVHHLQHPGCDALAQDRPRRPGRHLPRQDHEVERPAHPGAEPGCEPPRTTAIAVVHRSDGSGTTDVFTDYLSKVSPDWKDQGRHRQERRLARRASAARVTRAWPARSRPRRAPSATWSSPTPIQNHLPVAAIRNKAGQYVLPEIPAITTAAAGVQMPDTLHVSITDPPGAGAYPISSFTYILVYADAPDATKGKAIADFLWWAIHDGQKYAAALDYAPLPPQVVTMEEARLEQLHSGSKTLLAP